MAVCEVECLRKAEFYENEHARIIGLPGLDEYQSLSVKSEQRLTKLTNSHSKNLRMFRRRSAWPGIRPNLFPRPCVPSMNSGRALSSERAVFSKN